MSDGTVFLIDDDARILRALGRLLKETDFEVQAFESPEDFLVHHDIRVPGCAVCDVSLGVSNGLDLPPELARRGQLRPFVFITGYGDVVTSVRAMKLGAIDFLTKPVQETELIEAVRHGISRDRIEREQRTKLTAVAKRLSSLTPKEGEVMTEVVAGRLNKQIAGDLGITEKTVKIHRGRVMEKMGVRTVPDLVRMVELALNHLLRRNAAEDRGPQPIRCITQSQWLLPQRKQSLPADLLENSDGFGRSRRGGQ
jgi:FixJ family two-component response regulator